MFYKIYALVSGKKVFIGKTKAKNFSSVIQKHTRRKHKETRSLFSRNEPAPTVHLLETGDTEGYLAYRHVVAFCRLFIDQGYQVLNCSETIRKAMNLKSDTQRILTQIKENPLDAILENSKLSKPSDADETATFQHNKQQPQDNRTKS